MTLRSQAFFVLVTGALTLSPAFADTPLDDLIKPELNSAACFTNDNGARDVLWAPGQNR